ncbi:beta-ketoacyl synthase N-terminal-like domain-containing protein [Streptomyces sp. SCSIO ZS0520]|uniref:beta-ketoacyl synthase N-terminal-like domain-containing protein n=1 Tax=Streptomyces sp. SCSIO ZS0520 TaxID=2892996 RepID=UPI0021DA0EC6|nr:beta-ketoacyl synthase N-terminal-like domain-containing protein [Streptomyces sp. SCSIO ZS0520]
MTAPGPLPLRALPASAAPVVVTGTGTAVTGLTGPADLLRQPPYGPGGFDPVTGLKGRELRNLDRASRLALRAAAPALAEAQLLDADGGFTGEADTAAVVVSSSLGTLDTVAALSDTIAREGVTGLTPLGLPGTSSNVCAGYLAIRHGLRGPSLTVCNGPSSGLDALFWARVLLAAGRARTVLVVGVEPSGPAVTRLLGRETTDAAAAVVLERAEDAAARGAHPRALLAAYGRASSAAEAAAEAAAGLAAPLEGPVDLWLTGEQQAGEGELTAGAPRLDVEQALGPLSGALGVVQCAAAVAHLDATAAETVLASAGGGPETAAALLLTRSVPPNSERKEPS